MLRVAFSIINGKKNLGVENFFFRRKTKIRFFVTNSKAGEIIDDIHHTQRTASRMSSNSRRGHTFEDEVTSHIYERFDDEYTNTESKRVRRLQNVRQIETYTSRIARYTKKRTHVSTRKML